MANYCNPHRKCSSYAQVQLKRKGHCLSGTYAISKSLGTRCSSNLCNCLGKFGQSLQEISGHSLLLKS